METTVLDDGLRKWVYQTARENLWRVPAWFSLDDLAQEGFVTYCKCRNKYAGDEYAEGTRPIEIRTGYAGRGTPEAHRRQFMAFFKRAFHNRIADLAAQKARTPEVVASAVSEKLDAWERTAGEIGYGNLAITLASAPAELASALQALMSDAKECNSYLMTKFVERVLPSGTKRVTLTGRWIRETTERHYARTLGKEGIPRQLRELLLDIPAASGVKPVSM